MFVALWVYLVVVNIASFAAFMVDKRASRRRSAPRISESTLLTLAASGGAFGAVAGQQLLRHKTRKKPFRGYLWAIAAVEAGVIWALFLM